MRNDDRRPDGRGAMLTVTFRLTLGVLVAGGGAAASAVFMAGEFGGRLQALERAPTADGVAAAFEHTSRLQALELRSMGIEARLDALERAAGDAAGGMVQH